MLNRKIAISAVSILAAFALMGGATFALFSSSAEALDNTFSTGNANLLISEAGIEPLEFLSSIQGPVFENLAPGDSREFDFWLKNASEAEIDLALTADVSQIDSGLNDLDNTLLVSWICDADGDESLAGETQTSEFSPRAWFEGGNAELPSLIPDEEMFCRMVGRLPESADDTVSNQTVVFDVIYDGEQVL